MALGCRPVEIMSRSIIPTRAPHRGACKLSPFKVSTVPRGTQQPSQHRRSMLLRSILILTSAFSTTLFADYYSPQCHRRIPVSITSDTVVPPG